VVISHGRIEDTGQPERVYRRPRTRFTATFMGESTILPARALARATPGISPAAGVNHAFVAIRPESVGIGAAPDGHVALGAGTVSDLVFQGGFKRARIASEAEPGLSFTVHLPVGTPLAVGERVELHCRPDEIIALDE
jgi:spermidine/putrescine transport system ATP-binding protein